MRALVVYELMFGNTREIAEHVASGVRQGGIRSVMVVPACEAHPQIAVAFDLVVVGAPTHAHGLPSTTTRSSAGEQAFKDTDLDLDVDVSAPGVREWLARIERVHARHAAAFDTRVDAPAFLVGKASRGIGRRLHKRGFTMVAAPESFYVDRHNHLLGGEADRARRWGRGLAETMAPVGEVSAPSDGDRRPG